MASLCIVISVDYAVDLTIGVCVLTVATMGVGAVEVGVGDVGWVNTFTLYFLLAIVVFLHLPIIFVMGPRDVLTLRFVLGWAGLIWLGCIQFCCGWVWDWDLGLGHILPSISRYVLIFQMRKG